MTKCGCGCGGEASPGSRFIRGHNLRVNNPMKNPEIAKKLKGRKSWNKGLTKETDERVKRNGKNISKALIGRTKENYEYIQKQAEAMKGDNNPMKHPEVVAKVKGDNAPSKRPEVRKKISETLIALWNNLEYRELHTGKNHPKYGKTKETDEGIRKHSEKMTGRTKETHEGNRKQADALRGRTKENNESVRRGAKKKRGRTKEEYEYLKRHSEIMTGRTKENHEGKRRGAETLKQLWQNSDFAKMILKAQQVKPNKPEKLIYSILQNILPNEYAINVKGHIVIDGKIPDFVNINGKKKLIEFNGCYFHHCSMCFPDSGVDGLKETEKRIKLFKKYGYETLVIWEHELEDIDLLIYRILEFDKY